MCYLITYLFDMGNILCCIDDKKHDSFDEATSEEPRSAKGPVSLKPTFEFRHDTEEKSTNIEDIDHLSDFVFDEGEIADFATHRIPEEGDLKFVFSLRSPLFRMKIV